MLIFILLNLINFINTYLVVRKYFNFEDIIDSLLAFSILFYAQVVIILTCLGILNLLYLNNVILLEFFILFILIFHTKTKISELSQDMNAALTNIFNTINFNKLEIFCISIILGFGFVKVMINLVNPPFGWDDLNYHFTFAVEWLKYGNLINPIIVSDYPAPTYFPINGSLIFFWLILPLKSVFLADLGQLPFFIIAFLSVFSIARKLDINKNYSLFAAILFTITPNYFKQLEIAYIDVIIAALFFVSLNYFLIFYKELDARGLILSTISLGMFIGTKTIALPQSAIILIFFIFIIFKQYKRLRIGRVALFMVLLLILPIFFGGFTYIRNFILTKNILYPLDIKIFGFHILKGVMGRGYPGGISNFSLTKLLFHEGIGAGFMVFAIPGIILAAIKTIREKKIDLAIIFLFILIPYLYLIYRFIIALPNLRYLYPWLGICYIVSFFAINKLKLPIKIINFLIIICLIASISEISGHSELIISIIVSIFLYLTFIYFSRFILSIIYKPIVFMPLVLIFFIALHLFSIDYINNEYPRYEKSQRYSGFWPDAIRAWIWLNEKTNGNNIAYVGRPVPFPLYGSNFKNNVYYVSVNKTDPAKLHYFPRSYYYWDNDYVTLHKNLEAKGNYRSDADYSVWLNNLLKRNTDYLFIYSLHQTKEVKFPLEDGWGISHPGTFNLVFRNDTIHIYKIIR